MSTGSDDASSGAIQLDITAAAELNTLLRQLSTLQANHYFANLIYIPSETLQSSLNGGEIDDNVFFLVQNAQLLISRLILLADGSDAAADATARQQLRQTTSTTAEQLTAPLTLLTELTMTLRSFVYDLLPSELQQQVGEDGAPLDGTTAFNHAISQRAVPLEHIVQSLFVLSFVSTKLRLELVLAQLKANLQLEMNLTSAKKQSSEYKSLQMVHTLVSDFESVYKNVLRFVPATLDISSEAQRLHQASQAELQQFASMVSRYYYQLADWLLQVEVTLTASEDLFVGAAGEAPSAALTAHVTKVELDAAEGTVDLSLAREDVNMPWGLLFNEQGKLVDVDLFVRLHASSATGAQHLSGRGEIAHQLLKLSRTGATIVSINDQPVLEPGDDASSLEVYAQRAMSALQQLSATKTNTKTGVVGGRKRLHLRVRSDGFKRFTASEYIFPTRCTVPQAILSGAPVSLAFAKVSHEARWPFACEDEIYTTKKSLTAALAPSSPLDSHFVLFRIDQGVLEDRSSFLHYLPPETTKFLLESCSKTGKGDRGAGEKKDLALVKVNGISVNSATHAALLLETSQPPPSADGEVVKESAEIVQLELVVLPPKAVRQAQFLKKNRLDPVHDAIQVETFSVSQPAAAALAATAPPPPAPPAVAAPAVAAAAAAAAPAAAAVAAQVTDEIDDAEVRRIVMEMSRKADTKTKDALVPATAKPSALVAVPQEEGVLNLESAAEAIIAELQKRPRSKTAPKAKKAKKTKPQVEGKVVATFDNGVQLLEFAEHELTLVRPADVPSWGMSIAINKKVTPPTMELLSLPKVEQLKGKNAKLASSYQKQFERIAAKKGEWYLRQVGTKKITNPDDVMRYMSSLKRMKLIFWRR